MFEQPLTKFAQLPTKQSSRKCTDVICTIIGAIFALTMLILAFVYKNTQNYYKTNFPTDSQNKPCAYNQNAQFAYVYFPDINNPQKRVCVSACPTKNDNQLLCRTNAVVSSCIDVQIYDSTPNFKRLGGFCVPTDQASSLKLIKNAKLMDKWTFLNNYDVIRLCLLISLFLGIVWMILVQCIPRHMSIFAMIIAALVLIAFGILLCLGLGFQQKKYQPWNIVLGALFLLIAIFLIVFSCLYKKRIKLSGVFLNHSTIFLSQNPINFVFIPIFIILTVGLIVLCFFQHLAFLSHNQPIVAEDDIYLHTNPIHFLQIINLIQFIWGLQFLKDSFNFMISGNSSEWYINKSKQSNCYTPVNRYFKYNFGSVVGGSFLNAFFNIVNFVYQSFKCYPDGNCGLFASCCTVCTNFCGCFFDLVRTDTYAYINLTGIPYCNAARNCQVLCENSNLFIGSQSCIFFYRLCAHISCIGLVCLLSYWLMMIKASYFNVGTVITILILSYCIVTYFIDIHADAAQGLQITYLADIQLTTDEPLLDFRGLKGQLAGIKKSYEDVTC